MTKLFCLLILQISLSLQSSESGSDELENWSFELDSEGISEESSKPFSGRIYGGQEAEPNSWPFIVSLQIESPYSGRYMHDCAGSIINEWTVVSAAHCFTPSKPPDKWLVLPGAHDSVLPADLNEYDGPTHKIHSLYVPKKWNSLKLFHDIAILVMDKPFKFNDIVKPIKMMDYDDHSQLRTAQKCKIAGWGQTEDQTYPINLQEVEVPLIDLDKCKSNYEKNNYTDMVTDLNFCAGQKGIDSCFGDSGGPMMCKDKLAGVVSFGPNSECGNEHMPGVYTNISIFAPVIDQTFRTKIQRQLKKRTRKD